MTAEELAVIVQRNPSIKITLQGGSALDTNDLFHKKHESKYRNQKVYEYADGFVCGKNDEKTHGAIVAIYDSTKEYLRYSELLLLQRAQKISGLKRQVKYILQDGFEYQGRKIQSINYKADFEYQLADGTVVVEDVKAYDEKRKKYLTTAEFDLKWKMLKFKYPQISFMLI